MWLERSNRSPAPPWPKPGRHSRRAPHTATACTSRPGTAAWPSRRGWASDHRGGRARSPASYRDVLRVPCAAHLLAGTLIGRMPTPMAPLAIVLAAAQDGTLLARTLTALYLLATRRAGPAHRRLADRRCHTTVSNTEPRSGD